MYFIFFYIYIYIFHTCIWINFYYSIYIYRFKGFRLSGLGVGMRRGFEVFAVDGFRGWAV